MFSAIFNRASSPEERRIRAWCRKTLGLTPKDISLYRQALRHRSAVPDDRPDLPDNERLEFLGDAVLGTVVGQYLFRLYPDKGEGFLTRLRSKLVSRHQLSLLAKKVQIERVMEVNIGRGRDTAVPGNAMEALIGALFLDKGFEKTRKAVINLFNAHFDLKAVELEDRDSKSRLLEWGQKKHRKVEFVLTEEQARGGGRRKLYAADVKVDGKVCGTGKGNSKKKAEQEAAKQAARNLRVRSNGSGGDGGDQGRPQRPKQHRRRSRDARGRRRHGRSGGQRPEGQEGQEA